MKEEVRHRRDLVHFGKLLQENGYVAATDGNLSVRLDGQSVLITPTCIQQGPDATAGWNCWNISLGSHSLPNCSGTSDC
jgi:hypothetical protein